MRLLFIRHGDPDYERDGLTETGRKEAQLLVPRILKENVTDFYVSPLGRAQETAQPSLEATGKSADCRDWLQEFPAFMDITGSEFLQQAYPGTPKKEDGSFYERIVWDMLPGYWRNEKDYYDKDLWRNTPPADICVGSMLWRGAVKTPPPAPRGAPPPPAPPPFPRVGG